MNLIQIKNKLAVEPAKSGAVDQESKCVLPKVNKRRRPPWRVKKVLKLERLIDTLKQKRTTILQRSTETCTTDKVSTLNKMEQRLASFPDPWTNLWSSLTLDQTLDVDYSTLTSPTTSNISLRLDQKESGLFDNDFAGFSPKDDAGKPDLDFNYTLNNKDDFALEFDELTGEEDVENLISKMADSLPGEEYLESFVDLSFLLQENLPLKSEELESCQEIVPQTTEPLKRKLDDVVAMEIEEPHVANIDHDYVCKKPCTAAVVPEATEEVKPSSSSTVKVSPLAKYRERREKNNVASKRSRETRKMKFKDMEVEAVRLVEENEELKSKIEIMEKMAKEMKAVLIQKIADKK